MIIAHRRNAKPKYFRKRKFGPILAPLQGAKNYSRRGTQGVALGWFAPALSAPE